MTPEQRLTQMEKLLETTIKLTHKNTQKIDANTDAIANLTERVDKVTIQMGELTNIFIDSMAVIKEMQSQVRGLQMENRRILEKVFGEDELS